MELKNVYIKLENDTLLVKGNTADVISALCFILGKLAVEWGIKERSIEDRHADISVAIYAVMKTLARIAAENEAEA